MCSIVNCGVTMLLSSSIAISTKENLSRQRDMFTGMTSRVAAMTSILTLYNGWVRFEIFLTCLSNINLGARLINEISLTLPSSISSDKQSCSEDKPSQTQRLTHSRRSYCCMPHCVPVASLQIINDIITHLVLFLARKLARLRSRVGHVTKL